MVTVFKGDVQLGKIKEFVKCRPNIGYAYRCCELLSFEVQEKEG
jgi:hypothetical protein